MSSHKATTGRARGLPGLDWDRIQLLKQVAAPRQLALLSLVALRSWSPICQFLAYQRLSEQEAMEVTGEFLAFAFRRRILAQAGRQHPRFRWFWLASLKRFLADPQPGGLGGLESSSRGTAAFSRLRPQVSARLGASAQPELPDLVFHRAWLSEVVVGTLRLLRSQFEHEGKTPQFDLFRAHLLLQEHGGSLPPAEKPEKPRGPDYPDAARKIAGAKRAFKRLLAQEVQAYALSSEDASLEGREILGLLGL